LYDNDGFAENIISNSSFLPPKAHQNAPKWQFCLIFRSIMIKFCPIPREITINFYLPLGKSTPLYKPLGKSKQNHTQIKKYAKTPAKAHISK
jgi:hypothetical protein